MAHTGLFPQTLTLLLDGRPTYENILARLEGFHSTYRDGAVAAWFVEKSPGIAGWMGIGPNVIVPFRPEVDGVVVIDVIDRPWPDEMGDVAGGDPALAGAWRSGVFGGVWPEALDRAMSLGSATPAAKVLAGRHTAVLRLRLSYVVDEGGVDRPIQPADRAPATELAFITRIAETLGHLPQALCHFNPMGETLIAPGTFSERLGYAEAGGFPALDLWCGRRLFRLDAMGPDWRMLDVVGLGQLDLPDLEACFPALLYDAGEVDAFLLCVAQYLLKKGDVMGHDDTMDGPGDIRWRAMRVEDSQVQPPRPVIRWIPGDGRPGTQRLYQLPAALDPETPGERAGRRLAKWVKSLMRRG